jgi:hypothetical protein
MHDILAWFATVATIGGALLTASNLGARVTGSGFVVFLFGSLAWLWVGLITNQPALIWTDGIMTFLNAFGIWRWLGRQAKVEEWAKLAAEASSRRPGEDLFAVSLLSRAKVLSGTDELGTCVDAMGGCDSGRLVYVVVSEGGLAGVGERLRRLDWSDVVVSRDAVRASIDRARFCALPEVERDAWPAR